MKEKVERLNLKKSELTLPYLVTQSQTDEASGLFKTVQLLFKTFFL